MESRNGKQRRRGTDTDTDTYSDTLSDRQTDTHTLHHKSCRAEETRNTLATEIPMVIDNSRDALTGRQTDRPKDRQKD